MGERIEKDFGLGVGLELGFTYRIGWTLFGISGGIIVNIGHPIGKTRYQEHC